MGEWVDQSHELLSLKTLSVSGTLISSFVCGGWVDGCIDGWMGGWMGFLDNIYMSVRSSFCQIQHAPKTVFSK